MVVSQTSPWPLCPPWCPRRHESAQGLRSPSPNALLLLLLLLRARCRAEVPEVGAHQGE